MSQVYRDDLHALRMRVRDLDAQIASRVAGVVPGYWDLLPTALLREVSESLPPRGAGPEDTPPSLSSALATRERHLAALDAGLALLPEIESARCLLAPGPPALAPEPGPGRTLFGAFLSAMLRRHAAALEAILRRYARGATLAPAGRFSRAVAVTALDTPVAVALDLAPGHGDWEPVLRLATSVPAGLGPLALRPDGAAARGLAVDAEFDGIFATRGDPASAAALLGPGARAQLLRIARYEVPALDVARGGATLRWMYEPDADCVDAALRLLAAARRTCAPALRRG